MTYIKGTFLGSLKNCTTLRKEAYAIHMAFKKFSYYLYDTKLNIKCDHAPWHKFPTTNTLKSKVNNWGTELASMSHVIFEHIKGTSNILEDCISRLRSTGLYNVLDSEGFETSVNQKQYVHIKLNHVR